MREKFPTRREAIEDSPDKPEFIRAIETLQEVGILTPMKELDLFHGRSGHGERWTVVEVDNAGNNTGNKNINKIPVLHTSTRQVASEFAATRTSRANAKGDVSRAEVYKIVANDPDAGIIDRRFDWGSLSQRDYERARDAIRATLPAPLEGSPLKFENRHAVDNLRVSDFTSNPRYNGYITKEQIADYARRYHLTDELTTQLCGAINARRFLGSNPETMGKIVGAFTENTGEANINGASFPINREYVASWLKRIHAVGEVGRVQSATLKKGIETFMLFDHERVNTEDEVDRERRLRNQRFGKMTLAVCREQAKQPRNEMQEVLKNDYATPRQTIEAAKRVPGFKEIFEADAGNWEKFTLEQHTETVLENFEYNYADKMPAGLLPLMKLGLLLHDVGKPLAVRNNEKGQQERYNLFMAEKFMQTIGTSDKDREFILRMIGPGKTMMSEYLLKDQRREKYDEINRFCANTFQRYTGKKATDWDAHGVFAMIMALQTCDSAAYTTMALTKWRLSNGKEVTARNAGSFDKRFASAQGMTKRKVAFRTR